MSRVQGPLTAGAAETTITPPVGTPAVGTIQRSSGVHDELFARALVLGDGETRVAIVSLDLIGMDFVLADAARRTIHERTGISTSFVHCTHNHSAPFTIPWSVLGPRWPTGPVAAWHAGLPNVLGNLVATAAERLGMMWSRSAHSFATGLTQVREYHREYETLNTTHTTTSGDGYRIGSWLANQRAKVIAELVALSAVSVGSVTTDGDDGLWMMPC